MLPTFSKVLISEIYKPSIYWRLPALVQCCLFSPHLGWKWWDEEEEKSLKTCTGPALLARPECWVLHSWSLALYACAFKKHLMGGFHDDCLLQSRAPRHRKGKVWPMSHTQRVVGLFRRKRIRARTSFSSTMKSKHASQEGKAHCPRTSITAQSLGRNEQKQAPPKLNCFKNPQLQLGFLSLLKYKCPVSCRHLWDLSMLS